MANQLKMKKVIRDGHNVGSKKQKKRNQENDAGIIIKDVAEKMDQGSNSIKDGKVI